MGRIKTREIALETTLERMTPGETEDHRRWGGHAIICEKCQQVIEGITKFHRCRKRTVRVTFQPKRLEREVEEL